MRFDFIANFNPGRTIPWMQSLEMIREQCLLAEQAGFTTAWFTEHHFAHNGYMNAPPNPIQMATHVAAHTTRLRVGTCPVVLPDWHPLRVAEDMAMLDNMSLGRVDFGVAKGVNERTTLNFHPAADRRDNATAMRLFQENLDVILKAWTSDAFHHKGEFWEFPVPGWYEKNRFFEPHDPRYHAEDGEYKAMYVHPRPYQDPHPPLWLLSNAPPTFQIAGEKGWGVISMAASPKRTLACWEPYRAALSKTRGQEVALGQGVGVNISIYVGETMEEAKATVRDAVNSLYAYFGGARPAGEWTKAGYLDEGEECTPEMEEMDWFDFLNARGIIMVGDAKFVTERLQEAKEAYGLDHVVLMQQHVGVEYKKILKSWERFITDVLPVFGTESTGERNA